jgi:multimeric flavodoxin WrbA
MEVLMTMADKTKNVLIILGSPRKKGNSAALAEQIAKGAQAGGAKVESVYLHSLNISPCQSCWTCYEAGARGCAIDDDMQTLYPKLLQADAWVIASPVYWFSMSGQTKVFMDRLLALPSFDKKAFVGRKIAVAMSFGDTNVYNSGCVNALRSFEDAFKYVKANLVGMVYGSAHEPGVIRENASLMAEAERLGKKLVADEGKGHPPK